MLCTFAHNFPSVVGRFLDQAADLGRAFREETITDMLMGALVALKPMGIDVRFPNEQRTGADMEWIFVRRDGSTRFHLLIQAKKIHGTGAIWTRRSFPEIFHRVGGGRTLQSDLLIQECLNRPATFPLYMFYTNQSVCDMARAASVNVEGVSLANGHYINSLVKQRIAGAITAFDACSLSALHAKMLPLTRILCPAVRIRRLPALPPAAGPIMIFFIAGDGTLAATASVPTPEAVRESIREVCGPDVPGVTEGPFIEDPESESARSRYRVVFTSPSREEEQRLSEATGD